MRYIYVSRPGGKPLNIGVNQAKRVARYADRRDQLQVLKTLGAGLPRQHGHHQQLVRSRHRYYHEAQLDVRAGQRCDQGNAAMTQASDAGEQK